MPYGNHGCRGGDVHTAFLYVIQNDGVDTEYAYRYEAKVKKYLNTLLLLRCTSCDSIGL